MVRPLLTITVEIDGQIDLGQGWLHEFPIWTQKEKRYSQFLRTDEPKPYKLAPTVGEEQHDNTALQKLIDSVNISSNINTLLQHPSIQSKKTKEYQKQNKNEKNSKKKNKKRGKKKTKKYASIESLDHDKINLDDVSPKIHVIPRKGVTRAIDTERSKEIKARKIKEDTKINDFIQHIFKQTLKVFNDIKSKTTDSKLKHEINSLKHTFNEKFGKFISETYNHTLRTNLGKQKIILNTIDTSHKLLQRLINNLYKDMNKESLRTPLNEVNVFQKEVDRERDLENKHACKQFRICHLNDEFSDFVSDIIVVILLSDDGKVKQASDALTEAVKNTDFDNVLNYDLQNKLKSYLGNIEKWDAFMTRAMFIAVKSLIRNKNKPIAIYNSQDNYLANKTIAFQNIINLADEKLPKNDNVNEWEKIKQDLIDWKEDKNKEPLKIAENFVRHFKEKVLDKLDYDGRKQFNKSMEVLLSHF
ncbi:unnamed protein product [Pieris macdunnoughi]|uniref:Uncharacterized protein n=1 Tax=Pieris macdunnoughi TaxID=345717 RepID=A0A821VV08_9NEOP|nr:unnamed protein product [Pieris macdunnoughi]